MKQYPTPNGTRVRRWNAPVAYALWSLGIAGLLALSGCGGGGDNGNPAGPAEAASSPLALDAITVQPQGQTAPAGQSVPFSVKATGSGGPFTYQWRRNGVAIAGATAADYTLPMATLPDEGARFDVVVTGRNGALTSAAAALSIDGAVTLPVSNVLFIGNSFTHGNADPVLRHNAANVVDLNGSGFGGLPGIVKTFATQAGLNWAVHIEAVSSQTLQYHHTNKLAQIGSKRWATVVMQEYSTLDPAAPGDPTRLRTYSKLIEQHVHGGANVNANPQAQVFLLATWARPDQIYPAGGRWSGTSIEKMTADLRAAYDSAAAQDPQIQGVIPVGDAFVLAVARGLADRNPYDGLTAGLFDLWGGDHYHASAAGSYLEALVVWGRITGLDPRAFGSGETAAAALGIAPARAEALQDIAYRQLNPGAITP